MSVYPAASARTGLGSSRGVLSRKVIVFVVPCLLFARIHLVGVVYIPEVLLLVALPGLLREHWSRRVDRLLRTSILLAGLWLWAQIASDILNQSSPVDFARGWANIGFTLTNLAAVALLLRGDRQLHVYFGWGVIAGLLITQIVAPSALAAEDPWKFGIGGPVTMGVALLASRRRIYDTRVVPIAAMAAVGVLNLVLGFRSLAVICVLTAAYLAGQVIAGRAGWYERRFSLLRFAAVCAAGVAIGLLFFNAYAHLAKSGSLGAQAREKYLSQQGTGTHLARISGPLAVLVDGRPELYASLLAVRDAPLLGHGSRARGAKYVTAVRDAVAPGPWRQTDDTIPTHSELFGAWVDAGIGGAAFWIWAAYLDVRLLAALFRKREPFTPLLILVSTLFIWDVFFSPFGADRRLTVPYFISLVVLGIRLVRSTDDATPVTVPA